MAKIAKKKKKRTYSYNFGFHRYLWSTTVTLPLIILMNRRGQKELPDFISVTELRSSCQPFHCYRKKMDVIKGSKHAKNSGLEGCETQGIYSTRHTDGDTTLWIQGILNPGANFIIFPQ